MSLYFDLSRVSLAHARDAAAEMKKHRMLVESVRDFIYVCENLPALADFDGKRCDTTPDLCGRPECNNCGCINNKIADAREALAKSK